ncbi:MAG: hypothetical protein SH847_05230 [Roseiflexaceae bacterium]|nr:hypothetical protein [Roseiflexaceae bacterium]
MNISSILRPRTLVMAAMVLILSVSAYGFAAANTVPATNAGDGAGTISGYTASSVVYLLETADPTKLDKVTFTLTPDATGAVPSVVKVQLAAAGTWYTASNVSGNDWVVDPAAGALTTASVTTLHIVAHD